MTASLPIDAVLGELRAALTDGCVVLEAPPGAGKTTRVPLALVDQPWQRGRIVMLEPRRLAARVAATRIASQLDEPVGATVGYRIRGDAVVSRGTRIEVVTEGVLTRMLQQDPSLPGVSLVIFDEFHERSLPGDIGLALVLGASRVLRDDLRVLVMSATLDGDRVAGLLGGAPRIRSTGREFPVTIRHDAPRPGQPPLGHIAAVVRQQIQTQPGSVLVFLSGAGEIERVAGLLRGALPRDVDLHRLHGGLSGTLQDAAIVPAPPGRRKVVLATNVAETSITIDGIAVVVDGGYERVPRFSPRTGMSRLETVRITRASADQRAGRAGRTGPGVAIRCWSGADQAGLVPHARAAILDADLAPLALDLAAAGFPDPTELPWLDPPPAAHYAVARELLVALGATDSDGRVTESGTAMLGWGVGPRLAHLLVRAAQVGVGTLACAARLAALVENRDVLRGGGRAPPVDLRIRLDLLERDADQKLLAGVDVDHAAVHAVRDDARRLERRGSALRAGHTEPVDVGVLASWAWPDRVARRRGEAGRFVLRSGRGARLDPNDPLAHAEWLVAVDIDDVGREGRIVRAVELVGDDAADLVTAEGTTHDEVTWDAESGAVVIRRRLTLGAIVVRDDSLGTAPVDQIAAAFVEGVRTTGIGALPWSPAATATRHRLGFLHHHDPERWADVSDEALMAALDDWLVPVIGGLRRLQDLARVDLGACLLAGVPGAMRRHFDHLAPDRITLPSGTRVAIDYQDPRAPVLAVRLQEVFGLAETPRVLDGRVSVVMHLLSPAGRPVQVTRDLASFWATGYFEVRRDLRGRYPRHRWPDDPAHAAPGIGRPRHPK